MLSCKNFLKFLNVKDMFLDHKISNEKGTNYPKNWQMTNINRMTRI